VTEINWKEIRQETRRVRRLFGMSDEDITREMDKFQNWHEHMYTDKTRFMSKEEIHHRRLEGENMHLIETGQLLRATINHHLRMGTL